jgi:C-terminal processing protease CtpA/Prc
MNKYCLILLVTILFTSCQSVKITENTDYSTYLRNDKLIITKDSLLNTKEIIKKYHPNPFNSITEAKFDSLIHEVAKTFPSEPIPETEYLYQYRKVFDTLTYGDPHFLILPQLRRYPEYKLKGKHIKVWPFNMICINDSLIINESLNPQLRKGDLLLSVNGKSAKEIVKYTYHYRFLEATFTQAQNHFCFAPNYNIELLRNGKKQRLNVSGVPLHKYRFKGEYYPELIYDTYQTGYFGIHNFDNNKYMINRLSKFIKKVQSKGYQNLIIDIRKNPGGRGDRFDELISLFCDKDTIDYQSGSRVMVSKATLDYGFPEDSIGKVCTIPKDELIQKCPLQSEKYLGKMNIYVLVSKYTASTASTFANIIQYNNLGTLIGEPLAHNALRYGEITTAKLSRSIMVLSTMEMDEYSNQINGIIQPDILIPYKTSEYMKGGDPILQHTLTHIKSMSSITKN